MICSEHVEKIERAMKKDIEELKEEIESLKKAKALLKYKFSCDVANLLMFAVILSMLGAILEKL